MIYWLLILAIVLSPIPAYAQEVVIEVNQTTPCFLNYSAGIDLWRNCGADEDYLDFALAPWEWITGGWFSMLIVSLLIMVTYIKYHKAAYPIMLGVMFLPVSFFLFPEVFISWAAILMAFAIAIFIWYGFIRQTRE